jgi:hypothetical protein
LIVDLADSVDLLGLLRHGHLFFTTRDRSTQRDDPAARDDLHVVRIGRQRIVFDDGTPNLLLLLLLLLLLCLLLAFQLLLL